MKSVLLGIVILLTGCATTTVPVKHTFPSAPATLTQPCPDLDLIDKPTVLLSELIYTVTRNYMKYHDCRAQVDGWNDWYVEQRSIFESVNK